MVKRNGWIRDFVGLRERGFTATLDANAGSWASYSCLPVHPWLRRKDPAERTDRFAATRAIVQIGATGFG